MAEYVEVVRAGPGWTEVKTSDGKIQRVEGNRNWRNNNPGNIEYGNFAKSMGAIGTDGRFAVFPTYESGRDAKSNLIFESPNYRNLSISGAINRYAPPFENNTNSYINQVAQAAGVSPSATMSSLNPQQRQAVLDAMQRVEGWKVGTINGAQAPASALPIMSYAPQQQPASTPATRAIGAATQGAQPQGFFGALASLVPQNISMPQMTPGMQSAAAGALLGTPGGRNMISRAIQGMNIGAAPQVTQGHTGMGTLATAVNSRGANPVTLTGRNNSSSSGAHGNMNMDIYRANAAVLGGRNFNQQSINDALSRGKTLHKLA